MPLLAQRDFDLELLDPAKDFLAEIGYDPAFGARPLRRAIQEHVLEPLSEKILAGVIRPGQKVIVNRDNQGLRLEGVTQAAQPTSTER